MTLPADIPERPIANFSEKLKPDYDSDTYSFGSLYRIVSMFPSHPVRLVLPVHIFFKL